MNLPGTGQAPEEEREASRGGEEAQLGAGDVLWEPSLSLNWLCVLVQSLSFLDLHFTIGKAKSFSLTGDLRFQASLVNVCKMVATT